MGQGRKNSFSDGDLDYEDDIGNDNDSAFLDAAVMSDDSNDPEAGTHKRDKKLPRHIGLGGGSLAKFLLEKMELTYQKPSQEQRAIGNGCTICFLSRLGRCSWRSSTRPTSTRAFEAGPGRRWRPS